MARFENAPPVEIERPAALASANWEASSSIDWGWSKTYCKLDGWQKRRFVKRWGGRRKSQPSLPCGKSGWGEGLLLIAAPYGKSRWRSGGGVVRGDGRLWDKSPGGVEEQVRRLGNEDVDIVVKRGVMRSCASRFESPC